MEDSGSVRGIGWLCIISALGKRAGVVQWQYRSFPSFGRGFDSHRPLQIQLKANPLHCECQKADSKAK